MMDDKKRAERAAELLNNEVLGMALDVLEKEVVTLWEQCPARDKEGKEELWRLYKTSKKFRGVIMGYIQAGKLARLQPDLTLMQKAKAAFG